MRSWRHRQLEPYEDKARFREAPHDETHGLRLLRNTQGARQMPRFESVLLMALTI